jgi:Flp pilus assembly protein TadD
MVVYIGTLSFGFVYDDNVTIVQNPMLRFWHVVPQSFASVGANVPLYRPLTNLWFYVNNALFGLKPACWHLTAVLLHVLITYLVFRMAERLLHERKAALIAALLFGLHPVHIENVAWISAANDLLVCVLLLGSFLLFLRYQDEGVKRWQAASVALFAPALLSKETAAVFPALIFGFCWIYGAQRETWKARLKGAVRTCAPYVCVLLAYLAARSYALRNMVPTGTRPLNWSTMLLTWPSVLWFDVRQMLLPVMSSEFYPLDYVTHAGLHTFVLPTLLLVCIVAGVAAGIRRLHDAQLATYACLWIILPLLPTLYLRALTPNDFVHDRFLYLPSVGVVILAALVIRQLNWSTPACGTGLRNGVVAVLVVACAAGTIAHQPQWASDVMVYQNGLKYVPESENIKDNLANALFSLGQFERAIPLYMEILQHNPTYWRSQYNLGYAYYKTGRYVEAEQAFQRAIQLDSQDPDQFIYLALTQMSQKKLSESAQNAERAIKRSPVAPGYHHILGVIAAAQGNRTQAVSEFQIELHNHPDSPRTQAELQRIQTQQSTAR